MPTAGPECDRCFAELAPEPTTVVAHGPRAITVTLCPGCARVLETWIRTNPRSPRLKEPEGERFALRPGRASRISRRG